MQLAKNVIDVGLSTNNLEPMLGFWQKEAGLRFDHVLPVRRGQKQYRHDATGSVVKLNHHLAPLQIAPQSGYRELIIAKEAIEKPVPLTDPDGNSVRSCLPDMMASRGSQCAWEYEASPSTESSMRISWAFRRSLRRAVWPSE